ncbi:MAG: hypothetical protein ACREJ2_00685 [Planctomycetota bacterium]
MPMPPMPPSHNETLDSIITLSMAALIVGGGLYASYLNKRALRRVKAMVKVANRYGLRFESGRCGRSFDEPPFQRGENRYPYNSFAGVWGGFNLQMGDFHYEVGSPQKRGSGLSSDHVFSYCHLEVHGARLRPLMIRPQGLWSHLIPHADCSDIQFESTEFSKRFMVQAPDRKYAFQIVTAQVMELLLQSQAYCVFLGDQGVLLLCHEKLWEPEDFVTHADFAADLLRLIPEYVWEEYKTGAPDDPRAPV